MAREGGTLADFLVSGFRLSAALTLYGLGQFEKVAEAAAGERGLPGAAETLVSATDGLTGFLENSMSETKKEALRSFSRVSAKAIEKTVDALSRGSLVPAGNRLTRRRDAAPVPAEPAGASLAIDVLGGLPDT